MEEIGRKEPLTKYPVPEFITRQASSYDRMSVSKDQPGWFANYDLCNFYGIDSVEGRRELVLLNASGPGAVVRFWMTFAGIHPGEGTLRIYIDGEEKPVAEGHPMDILSGGRLAPEPLSTSQPSSYRYDRHGHTLYLPIPYAKSCKITYESNNVKVANTLFDGENVYYNIEYRCYGRECRVKSFSGEELEKNRGIIKDVCEKLQNPGRELQNFKSGTFDLKPGKGYVEKMELSGSAGGAINFIGLKLIADDLPQALRSVVMEIEFDGVRTVWVPAGDFFGTGWQLREHKTLFTEVGSDGQMICRWLMPFKKSVRIKLINYGKERVSGEIGISSEDYDWAENSMYFGASWREYNKLDAGGVKSNAEQGRGAFDLNYVTLKGKGIYAGDALALYNSSYAWWGEGDEKIYVDGESFPSHFGTGSEDYYGYAWCRPELFISHPFISQPDGSGNLNAGYTINLRNRLLDKIPFTKGLIFDMELWSWTAAIMNFAPVTYYYMLPGGTSNIQPDIKGVRRSVVTERHDMIPAITGFGKYDFEDLLFQNPSSGKISFSRSANFETYKKSYVNWNQAVPGDSVEIVFYSSGKRAVNITAGLVHGVNCCVNEISLNGVTIGNIDNYSDKPSVMEYSMGRHNLKKGKNVMKVVLSSSPGNHQQTLSAGFDYLVLGR